MNGWRWVSKTALLLLHGESLAEHGGAGGLRDEGLLESALARPVNLSAYGHPDVADLAASYAVGLTNLLPYSPLGLSRPIQILLISPFSGFGATRRTGRARNYLLRGFLDLEFQRFPEFLEAFR